MLKVLSKTYPGTPAYGKGVNHHGFEDHPQGKWTRPDGTKMVSKLHVEGRYIKDDLGKHVFLRGE